MNALCAQIEAILFVSGDPVLVEDLAHALNLTVIEAEQEIDALRDELSLSGHGLRLNRGGGTVYLSIEPKYAPQVEAYLQPTKRQTLSQAVLETLSVIAYLQPATRNDVEQVRGVKCDYSVQALLNHGLIEECGRKEVLGRPILYRTTDKFLQRFGIESLSDLPKVELKEEKSEGEIGV